MKIAIRGNGPRRDLCSCYRGGKREPGRASWTIRVESTLASGIRRKHLATTFACAIPHAKRRRHGRRQSEGQWLEQPADERFVLGSRLTAPSRTNHGQTDDYELACLASCDTSVRELTHELAELDGFVRRIREAHREVRQQLQERAASTCEDAPDSDAFEMLADLLWKYNDMFRLRGSFQVDPISPSFIHQAQVELMDAISTLCEGTHRDRLHLALQPASTPPSNHVLQFCGREMDPQASIGDYVGGHEKTTMLLRLGSRGQVLPTCPHVDEETQKALIAYCYRKEQQEKTSKPCESTDATSAWSDPTSLHRALQGITNLRMH